MKTINKAFKKYEDMLHLPHHVSSQRVQMKRLDRAAQFAPFAAVVGHESAVKEAARYTDQKRDLDEMGKAIVDEQLREVEAELSNEFDVEVVYFKADGLKTGGQYIVYVGKIKKIDIFKGEIHMIDETLICIDDIYSIINKPPLSDQ